MRQNLLNDTVIGTVNDHFEFLEKNIRKAHELFKKYDGESEFFYAAYYFPLLTTEVFKTDVSEKIFEKGQVKTFFEATSKIILSDNFAYLKNREPFKFAFAGNISAVPNEIEAPLVIQEIQKTLKRKWIEIVRSLDEQGAFFALYDERFNISERYSILEQELSAPPLIIQDSDSVDSYHTDKINSPKTHNDTQDFDRSF